MSYTRLRRALFMKAPHELRSANNDVLRVVRPLYVMPESLIHWFKTYSDYHQTNLKMIQSNPDHSVMITINEEKLEEIFSIQVDDTICAGTESIIVSEKEACRQFPSKGVKIIGKDTAKFNMLELSKGSDGKSI